MQTSEHCRQILEMAWPLTPRKGCTVTAPTRDLVVTPQHGAQRVGQLPCLGFAAGKHHDAGGGLVRTLPAHMGWQASSETQRLGPVCVCNFSCASRVQATASAAGRDVTAIRRGCHSHPRGSPDHGGIGHPRRSPRICRVMAATLASSSHTMQRCCGGQAHQNAGLGQAGRFGVWRGSACTVQRC